MKVIIAGSRTITSLGVVRDAIEASGIADDITEVVSGGAAGVDRAGERWAELAHRPVRRFLPDWKRFGSKGPNNAGYMRNREMASYADAAIVVWDGMSRGAAHMYETMVERGKPAFLYRVDDERSASR